MSRVIKYLLLGNGFDLHHKLPTKYIHIVRIFSYWSENHEIKFKSIGELYAAYFASFAENIEFDRANKEMHDFYLTHKSKLDNVRIEDDQILICFANCFWFNYFARVISQDIGWIDFENEIQKAIELFQYIIDNNVEEGEIVSTPKFADFKVSYSNDNLENIGIHNFKDLEGYLFVRIDRKFIDNHMLSTKWSYRADDIAEYLYKELEKVKAVINFYIINFINSILDSSVKSQLIPFIDKADMVINLNYTNTAESVYGITSGNIVHYHGEALNNNIVLGVNSYIDENITVSSAGNNSFIVFKKYYQRIIQNTDTKYLTFLNFLRDQVKTRKNNSLETILELGVIGHSLDKSDEDVIKELFSLCDKIQIYYYNITDYGRYIQKLTSIFGEKEFLKMRQNLKIAFHTLPEYIRDKV